MIAQLSPVVRLSLGLAALTVSLLLGAEMLGLIPNQTKSALEARQKICETLALQLSWAAIRNDRRSIDQILTTVVDKNPDILSTSLISNRSGVISTVGDHDLYWSPTEDGKSTPTDIQVPILTDRGRWGTLEITFEPLRSPASLSTWMTSTLGLVVFVGVIGFILFTLFLRRALRELDPSQVIPDHVKSAFDALAEGVLIMDDECQIVLANKSFARLIGIDRDKLVGKRVDDLGWYWPASETETLRPASSGLPWQRAINGEGVQTGVPMLLTSDGNQDVRTLVVNGAPIVDGEGNARGALATFDDVSELQKNNAELQETLQILAESKEEINRQNKELRFLATRDPLTRCLNRRAMMEAFEALFSEARLETLPLACAMIDIDHFKPFNDHYGHAAGDKVIRFVAKQLSTNASVRDVVARYGGEEFFMIMPGADAEAALESVERIRQIITAEFREHFTSSRDLTVSIGVTTLKGHSDSMNAMLNRADDALYAAKEAGRDRAVVWTDDLDGKSEKSKQAVVQGHQDTDASVLVQVLRDPEETQTLMGLNEKVLELDTLIEEKSGAMHRQHGFDELTRLPKRILFYDRSINAMASAQREGNTVAFLYVDIDMVRRVGDDVEPISSDELIKSVSARLAGSLQNMEERSSLISTNEEHTISRLGNSEFGIVLPDVVGSEAATWIVQQLFDSLNEPLQADGAEAYANCSIGISLYPSDGEDVETLVGRASQARHLAAASKGRHKYMFYAEDMNVRSYQQLKLEGQLRSALENNELMLHYQPVYDMKTESIVSFEALLRWNNPEMGVVGPSMFIHIAEQTGLILEIGKWTLRAACRQARAWVDMGLPELHVAVNLSPVQLRVPGLSQVVLEIIKEYGLSNHNLELEVTETALMDDVVQANHVIQDLRAAGVSIAIDDFGTGYSSLSHLKHMEVDKLKIDRSFVRDVTENHRDAAMVGSIIAMSKLMGMSVVAEGVETDIQFEFLKKRQCDMAQGFLMSRAVDAGQARALLEAQINNQAQAAGARRKAKARGSRAKSSSGELAELD